VCEKSRNQSERKATTICNPVTHHQQKDFLDKKVDIFNDTVTNKLKPIFAW